VKETEVALETPSTEDDITTATPWRINNRRRLPRFEASLPEEMIKIYAKLPKLFGKRDLDSLWVRGSQGT